MAGRPKIVRNIQSYVNYVDNRTASVTNENGYCT